MDISRASSSTTFPSRVTQRSPGDTARLVDRVRRHPPPRLRTTRSWTRRPPATSTSPRRPRRSRTATCLLSFGCSTRFPAGFPSTTISRGWRGRASTIWQIRFRPRVCWVCRATLSFKARCPRRRRLPPRRRHRGDPGCPARPLSGPCQPGNQPPPPLVDPGVQCSAGLRFGEWAEVDRLCVNFQAVLRHGEGAAGYGG